VPGRSIDRPNDERTPHRSDATSSLRKAPVAQPPDGRGIGAATVAGASGFGSFDGVTAASVRGVARGFGASTARRGVVGAVAIGAVETAVG
jgi:hypothetical protein